MELTPPSVVEFSLFTQEEYAVDDHYVTAKLQEATDLVSLITGLRLYPKDPRVKRAAKNAIMQYASWLLIQAEHADEINSPFTSERLGSYSYQKLQQRADAGEDTGIFWLDILLGFLRDDANGGQGSISVHSENVMNPHEHTYEEYEYEQRHRISLDAFPDYYGR